ncbi:hypothetical protein ACHQM5_004088 [Ranunculus cassubicifolius]
MAHPPKPSPPSTSDPPLLEPAQPSPPSPQHPHPIANSNPQNPIPILIEARIQHECTKEPSTSSIRSGRWCDLLKSPPPSMGKETLNFMEPNMEGGSIIIDEEILEEGAKEWENRVVGFFLDKKLAFTVVKEKAPKKWKLKGSMELALDGDTYYFTFSLNEDRERVIDEGPIYIADKLFIVMPWSREVEECKGNIKKVPVWVKLSKVPKHMWNAKGFSLIGSAIGKPICMDRTTEGKQMLSYARICIQVSADKELPDTVNLKTKSGNEFVIGVEYLWKPMVCTKCCSFGHITGACADRWKNNQEGQKQYNKEREAGEWRPPRQWNNNYGFQRHQDSGQGRLNEHVKEKANCRQGR